MNALTCSLPLLLALMITPAHAQPQPQWGGTTAASPVQRSQQAPSMARRALAPPMQAGGGGIVQLLTAPDDVPVQWGDQTLPAGAAKQQWLQQMAAAGERGQPERASTAASDVSTPQTIARGNQQIRGVFAQLDFDAGEQTAQSVFHSQDRQVAATVQRAPRERLSQSQRVQGGGTVGALSYRNDPVGWCQQNGNLPRISRVLADGMHLTPDGEFVLQGTCFGRARGTVQVTLPTPVGTLTLTPLEWADNKLLVKLPPEISGLAATEARLTVLRADQVLSQLTPMRFEPVWVETDVPSRMLRLLDCAVPGTCTTFEAPPAGLLLPGLLALLQPWNGSAPPRGAAALHISDAPIAGRDVFHVQLPDWARVSGAAEVIRQGYPQVSRVSVQVGSDVGDLTRAPGERPAATVTVNWQMTGVVQRTSTSLGHLLFIGPVGAVNTSQYGYCHYTVNLKALVPRGFSL
ncbi:MAG: hypothetical protein Q7J29_08085 [Stagnimonas sp.]|nr:hypothetical protein [Stagnimonas sp.]